MTYLLTKIAITFMVATFVGFVFGTWVNRKNLVDVTESSDVLRTAASDLNATQWESLWRRLDEMPEPKAISLVGVNERLDGLAYAVTNLSESRHNELVSIEAKLQGVSEAVGNLSAKLEIRDEPILSASHPDNPVSRMLRPEVATLKEARFGNKDNLRLISGIGLKLERLLNRNGIFYFWQIAAWTDRDIEFIDERLGTFRGRVVRDDWVGQADRLCPEPDSAQAPKEIRISA